MDLRTLKYGRMIVGIFFILVLAASCMKQENKPEAEITVEAAIETSQAEAGLAEGKEVHTTQAVSKDPMVQASMTQEPAVQEPMTQEPATQEPVAQETDKVWQELSRMSIEEKVLQMFIVTPEALTDGLAVISVDERIRQAVAQYPVGGIVYFNKNISSPDQLEKLLADILLAYKDKGYMPPFQCVDEEGGTVARLANNAALHLENVGNMSEIKDVDGAYEAGRSIGSYLSSYGFSLDFAPVVDVYGIEGNMMEKRSFGSDALDAAQKASAFLSGLQSTGVYGALKHFPGLGSCVGDTHKGYDLIDKDTEQLMQWDLVPFKEGIAAGAEVVMISHVSAPKVTTGDMPCSLSREVVTGLLREGLGFDGIVVTDAMNMAAVTDYHSPAEAACLAVEAGVDMILMPQDFGQAYKGLLEAVRRGDIPEDRINESVYRIARLKLK